MRSVLKSMPSFRRIAETKMAASTENIMQRAMSTNASAPDRALSTRCCGKYGDRKLAEADELKTLYLAQSIDDNRYN